MATVNIGTLEGLIVLDDRFTPVLAAAEAKLTGAGRSIEAFGAGATRLGRDLMPMGIAVGAVGAGSIKLAVDFESSFAGIIKTTDGVADKFGNLTAFGEQLKQGMRDLSKEMPVNVNELNRIGEAAGQLGIKKDAILGFTKTMAQLGVTTNLTSEEAADSLARFANATKMPQENFDRLGSAIVGLGNNSAATEADIVNFATNIAGVGRTAGLTEANIVGIAAAFSSAGIEAEAGGTAVQKVLMTMTKAAATGNEDLAKFAAVTGQTAEGFKQSFQTDAAGAFQAFVEGLGRSGTQAFAILDELGLKDQRLIRAFTGVAGAAYQVGTALQDSNRFWAENSALGAEAEARFRTVESQMIMLWNRFKDIGVTLGEALIPSLKVFMEVAEGMLPILQGAVDAFTALPAPVQAVVVAFGVMATALPFVLMAVGSMATGFGAIITTLGKVAPSLFTTSTHFEGLAKAAGLSKNALGQWTNASGQVVNVTRSWSTTFTSLRTGLSSFFQLLGGFGGTIARVVASFTSWSTVMATVGRVVTIVRVGLTAFAGPIGIAVTAFTLLVPILWKAVGGWEGIKHIAAEVGDFLMDLGVIIYDLAQRAFGALMEGLSTVGGWLSNIGSMIGGVFMSGWQKLVDLFGGPVTTAINMVKDAFRALMDFLAPLGKLWDMWVQGAKDTLAWADKSADAIRKRNAEAARGAPGQQGRQGDISLTPVAFGPPEKLASAVGAGGGTGAATAVAATLTAELAKTKAAVAALTAEQRANIKAGFDLGMSTDEIAKKLGIASPVIAMYKDRLSEGAKSAKEFAKEQLEAAKAADALAQAELEAQGGIGTRIIDPVLASDKDWRDAQNKAGLQKMGEDQKTQEDLATQMRARINEAGVAEIEAAATAMADRKAIEDEYWRYKSELANEEGLRLMEEDRKRMITYGSLIKDSFRGTAKAIPDIIVGAIQGGGNPIKAVAAKLGGDLGTSLTGKLSEALTQKLGKGLGGAIGGMLGPLGAMLGPLIGDLAGKLGAKIWGGLKQVFGGPSEKELKGREAAGGFRETIAQQLNAGMKAEAAAAGWADTLGAQVQVALNHAFAQRGLDLGQASQFWMRLWEAEKSGPEAVKKVITDLEAVLGTTIDNLFTTTDTAKTGIDETTKAAEGFDFAVTGSDDAIKALGETQDRVVNAMLAGFDSLMVKLDELIAKLSMAGGAMGSFDGLMKTLPTGVPAGSQYAHVDPATGEWVVPGGVLGPEVDWSAEGATPGGFEDTYSWGAATPAGEAMDPAAMNASANLTINTTVESQIAVGTAEEFRDAVTQGTLQGIEQGGEAWTAFRSLASQAVIEQVG